MAEPKAVYDWLDWLEKQLPFPIYRVSQGDLWKQCIKKRVNSKTLKHYYKTLIPAFVQTRTGRGMLNRKCTWDYKMVPIVRQVKVVAKREIAGWRREFRENKRTSRLLAGAFSGAGTPSVPKPVVIQWIGISTDEVMRIKPSRDAFIEHRWPLIEKTMSRRNCLSWWDRPAWYETRPFKYPPKSACIFCPYHNDALWLEMKTKTPDEFQRAVEYEKQFQKACADGGADNKPFLHSSLVPLDEVNLVDRFLEKDQPNLFNNECEGMCGV